MRFIEQYFYRPTTIQKALAFALLPISLFYCTAATLRRTLASRRNFDVAIISVGNLVLGGTGKTPFLIELASEYGDDVAVITRGYKRRSKGLLLVSHNGEILENVERSGDEAQLIAKKLPQATIIASENREKGIAKAIELGKKIVFLDDGFRFKFNKLNIVLRPLLEPRIPLCIPSGAYRERPSLYASADIIAHEGSEYKREVTIENPTTKMLLVTAIASPSRLERFLPEVVGKISYIDHAFFDKDTLVREMEKHGATSLLITEKDEVKMADIDLPRSVMRLRFSIDDEIKVKVKSYIESRLAKV